jgi:hypothetical protein
VGSCKTEAFDIEGAASELVFLFVERQAPPQTGELGAGSQPNRNDPSDAGLTVAVRKAPSSDETKRKAIARRVEMPSKGI